jgi:hypothetical protein
MAGAGLAALRAALDVQRGRFSRLSGWIGLTLTALVGSTVIFYLVDEALLPHPDRSLGGGPVFQYFEITVTEWGALVLLCGAGWSFVQLRRHEAPRSAVAR